MTVGDGVVRVASERCRASGSNPSELYSGSSRHRDAVKAFRGPILDEPPQILEIALEQIAPAYLPAGVAVR